MKKPFLKSGFFCFRAKFDFIEHIIYENLVIINSDMPLQLFGSKKSGKFIRYSKL